jgi:membrane-associated protein
MEPILHLVKVLTHLGDYVGVWANALGGWLYVAMFVVIFSETGLVVTPFLPGDSLLFAIGSVCALDNSGISIWIMMPVLIVAAVLGDAVNYHIGRSIGPRVFSSETSRFLNKRHLLYTQAFYEKYGGKTIIMARFVPIVRTFAPFVAGIGQMTYRRFFIYNVVGAVAWVVLLTPMGYWFGQLPFVKKNFELVILAIIFLSVLPAVIEFWRERKSTPRVAASSD